MAVKTGFVTIIGKPNAGKSTLLNALLGEKLSIVTHKPQTTRKRVLGILSESDYQIIFLDTPGILEPKYLLQQKLLDFIARSIVDADELVFIFDVSEGRSLRDFLDNELVGKALSRRVKKMFLLNKIDLSDEKTVAKVTAELEESGHFDKVIPISAKENFNTDSVLHSIIEFLPEHPKLYPDDQISDETERFFVSEIIRESLFEQFQDEVPYSCEVLIEDFREQEGRKDFISASIIVERESQKPIIIGAKGNSIKKLGSSARVEIEKFLERPVFLELRVKVKPHWRTDPNQLKNFGYTPFDE